MNGKCQRCRQGIWQVRITTQESRGAQRSAQRCLTRESEYRTKPVEGKHVRHCSTRCIIDGQCELLDAITETVGLIARDWLGQRTAIDSKHDTGCEVGSARCRGGTDRARLDVPLRLPLTRRLGQEARQIGDVPFDVGFFAQIGKQMVEGA